MNNLSFKDIIISLTHSIDLMSFFVKHHHQRVANISYAIGKAYGLSDERIKSLVISASLHDIGAISIKERDELIKMDVENPHPHAVLGSMMLKSFIRTIK